MPRIKLSTEETRRLLSMPLSKMTPILRSGFCWKIFGSTRNFMAAL